MARSTSPEAVKSIVDRQETYALIDVRERGEFNRAQIFTATSLPRRYLEFQMPRLVPVRHTLVIVCDDDGRRAALAATTLERMGYSNVALLEGGLSAWTTKGYPVVEGTNTPSKEFGERVLVQQKVPEIQAEELYSRLQRGERLIILDARTPEEFQRATLPGSRNVPGGELVLRIADILRGHDAPVIVHCGGRTRSIIGTQTLRRMGLSQVVGLRNGTMGWLLAGYQLQTGTPPEPLPLPSAEGRAAAERFAARLAAEDQISYLSISELHGLLDRRQEETLYLVDVRTAQEYQEGHIPGFLWFPGGQAVQRTDEIVAVRNGTIVLACDARARATATASWYRQMGFPRVYALDGGVTAWEARGLPLEEGWPTQAPAGFEEARATAAIIPPDGLKAALDSPGTPVVIDLETSRDFGEGHVPGAHWIPRGWLEFRIGERAPARETPIVLTCRDGLNSTLASATLREMGYTRVWVLGGGTVAWKDAGLPLETGIQGMAEQPDDVVIPPLGNRERMEHYLRWEEELGKKYSD